MKKYQDSPDWLLRSTSAQKIIPRQSAADARSALEKPRMRHCSHCCCTAPRSTRCPQRCADFLSNVYHIIESMCISCALPSDLLYVPFPNVCCTTPCELRCSAKDLPPMSLPSRVGTPIYITFQRLWDLCARSNPFSTQTCTGCPLYVSLSTLCHPTCVDFIQMCGRRVSSRMSMLCEFVTAEQICGRHPNACSPCECVVARCERV